MKDRYLVEHYILPKIIKNNPGKTRYWLREKVSKVGYSFYLVTINNMIDNMEEEGIVQTTNKNKLQVFITSKGVKALEDFEFEIKMILNIKVTFK